MVNTLPGFRFARDAPAAVKTLTVRVPGNDGKGRCGTALARNHPAEPRQSSREAGIRRRSTLEHGAAPACFKVLGLPRREMHDQDGPEVASQSAVFER